MPKVKANEFFVIHTDGSCKHGKGGWAYTVKTRKGTYNGSGSAENTTSMRMELTAIIEALKSLKKSGNKQVVVVTDCLSIVKIWRAGTIHRFSIQGWVFEDNRENENQDLWCELAKQLSCHRVTMQWVRSHHKNKRNKLCDKEARKARTVAKD